MKIIVKPHDIEIQKKETINETLISQLNAIENAMSYDEQTNITVTSEEGNAQLRVKASALKSFEEATE